MYIICYWDYFGLDGGAGLSLLALGYLVSELQSAACFLISEDIGDCTLQWHVSARYTTDCACYHR